MSFDFVAYLAKVDPTQSYDVRTLAGGVVNLTVRATRSSHSTAALSRFPEHSSLVLKHALPYVAGIGPEAPFSTFRQTIEARALSLFLPSKNSLHHICGESSAIVPTLLHHDVEDHVLIISDLGDCLDLSEYFGYLSAIKPTRTNFEQPTSLQGRSSKTMSVAQALSIGQRIGTFFAGLHRSDNVQMIQSPPYSDPNFLTHQGMLEMILDAAIKPIKGQLHLFPHLFSEDDVLTMYRRLESNFTRITEDDELSIALGDCWTGAFLIDRGVQSVKPQVGVIDWEFCSIGRGVHGDMAQLLAHLHLFRIAAGNKEERDSQVAIDSLLRGLSTEYRGQSQSFKAPWLLKFASPAPEPYSLTARVMRSAFLAHGAEMINNAFWKQWICGELCCGNRPNQSQNCGLVQDMVKKGWWYLQHAKGDSLSFVDTENWDAIQQEESIILPLFYDC